MRAILTVITLAASAYCQFRAFPLYPHHLHKVHNDPCKPLTPHCAFAMHGGHFGPRTYENLLGIRPYTTYLENIEHAFHGVKHHITAYKKPDKTFPDEEELRGSVSSQPLTQYVTILSAVNDLINQVALNGAEFYPQFYLTTVLKTLREVSNNPVQPTGRLWDRMDYFLEQISQIKSLIKHKQETKCEDPNSYKCDMIIHFALEQSSDQVLSLQADLLAARGNEVEILMKMATLIEDAAYYRQAEDFLSNGTELLEPLVMAGFETMKVLEAIASLPLPPMHFFGNKNNFSVDEMLNQLINVRSDEDSAIKAAQLTDDPVYDEKTDAELVKSEKLDYVNQPDYYDDYLVNSVEEQEPVVEPAEGGVHVDQLAEKQDIIVQVAKKQDHVIKLAKNQDHVVEPAGIQEHLVQLTEKQDNIVQIDKDLVVESTENSDKLQVTKNSARINELTHIITQREPKASLKHYKPNIIINYN